MSSLTRMTSQREAPNTHYMILYRGLLPQLTIEVLPQGLDIIKTSHKGANTSPMGEQQHTMIIHIRISSEVTNRSTEPVILLLYVDGLLLTGNEKQIVECKKKLAEEFDMKYLGLMHYFLGLEVWQSPKGIFLN